MDAKLRIVTQLPLRGLWKEGETVNACRGRSLSSSDITDLLRLGAVQFVVVDVGLKPRWIGLEDCYRFWMDEAKHHLAEPGAGVANDGVYVYLAFEWQTAEIADPIVVLERRH